MQCPKMESWYHNSRHVIHPCAIHPCYWVKESFPASSSQISRYTVTCFHARCSLRGTFGFSDARVSLLTVPTPLINLSKSPGRPPPTFHLTLPRGAKERTRLLINRPTAVLLFPASGATARKHLRWVLCLFLSFCKVFRFFFFKIRGCLIQSNRDL